MHFVFFFFHRRHEDGSCSRPGYRGVEKKMDVIERVTIGSGIKSKGQFVQTFESTLKSLSGASKIAFTEVAL